MANVMAEQLCVTKSGSDSRSLFPVGTLVTLFIDMREFACCAFKHRSTRIRSDCVTNIKNINPSFKYTRINAHRSIKQSVYTISCLSIQINWLVTSVSLCCVAIHSVLRHHLSLTAFLLFSG